MAATEERSKDVDLHGKGGRLEVNDVHDPNPLALAFVRAGIETIPFSIFEFLVRTFISLHSDAGGHPLQP